MIHSKLFSVACAILVWTLGICFFLISYYLPILENATLQSNITLVLGIIPSACLGTYLFYKKSFLKPSTLALIFITTAVILDALITVPVFMIPAGSSHSEFFGDPMFYTIAVEFYFVVYYFGKHLTEKITA